MNARSPTAREHVVEQRDPAAMTLRSCNARGCEPRQASFRQRASASLSSRPHEAHHAGARGGVGGVARVEQAQRDRVAVVDQRRDSR